MLILLLLLLQSASSQLQLGLKNYTLIKKENMPLVVLYCGGNRNSQKFLAEFTRIANGEHELLIKSSLPLELKFGVVDAQTEQKLMEKTQITNLPAVYLFLTDTQKLKYDGAWSGQSLINWIKKSFRDNPELSYQFYPSSLIHKFAQIQNKISMFNQVAILMTPHNQLTPLKQFTAAIKQLPEGFVYCHIHDEELTNVLGYGHEAPQLLVYSKLEDTDSPSDEARKDWRTYVHVFHGDINSKEDQLSFLSLYSWKGFFYVDDAKFQKLSHRADMYPTIILLHDKLNRDHDVYVEAMQKARYGLLKKAALGILDINGDATQRIEKIFALNLTQETPKLMAIQPLNSKDFHKFIDITLDPIEFYERMVTKQLAPFFKTQAPFAANELYDRAGVIKLTRDTYSPFINETNQAGDDVVVTYTAKGCESCKLFLQDFQQVAKKLKTILEGKIIFAKIDIGLNELDFVIDVYPHVKLYKAGLNGVVHFRAEYTEDSFLQWLKENSTHGNQIDASSDL